MKRQKILIQVRSVHRGLVVALPILLAGCRDDSVPALPQTPAERGMDIVVEKGCTACHALDGARGVGPSWAGIYGSLRTLKGGGSVLVDETYLRRALLEPAADIVEGFDNVMIPAAVSDAQIADIIALIKELGDEGAP